MFQAYQKMATNTLKLNREEREIISSGEPLLWLNPAYKNPSTAPDTPDVKGIYEAEARFARFAPLLVDLFPELEGANGVIESNLRPARLAKQ